MGFPFPRCPVPPGELNIPLGDRYFRKSTVRLQIFDRVPSTAKILVDTTAPISPVSGFVFRGIIQVTPLVLVHHPFSTPDVVGNRCIDFWERHWSTPVSISPGPFRKINEPGPWMDYLMFGINETIELKCWQSWWPSVRANIEFFLDI